MLVKERVNAFETNSSSSHSFSVLVPREEVNKLNLFKMKFKATEGIYASPVFFFLDENVNFAAATKDFLIGAFFGRLYSVFTHLERKGKEDEVEKIFRDYKIIGAVDEFLLLRKDEELFYLEISDDIPLSIYEEPRKTIDILPIKWMLEEHNPNAKFYVFLEIERKGDIIKITPIEKYIARNYIFPVSFDGTHVLDVPFFSGEILQVMMLDYTVMDDVIKTLKDTFNLNEAKEVSALVINDVIEY